MTPSSLITFAIAASATLAAAVAAAETLYSPLLINPLTTHQPIGNNEGNTNYYSIRFGVTSANGNGNSSSSGECAASWGDNPWTSSAAYSEHVPAGERIACGSSGFSFQLAPYFSIGNFSLAVQQNIAEIA